jgi:hypothetical protein
MNKDLRKLTKGLIQLELILQLELQEMREYLKSRFKRTTDTLNDIHLTFDQELVEQLSDDELDLLGTANVLSKLLVDLPPYISNKDK